MAHNCYIEPFQGVCCSCGGSQAKIGCDPPGASHQQHCPHWHLARGVLTPLLVVPLLPGQTQAQADADNKALEDAMVQAGD
jgi:hypothetical protein